MLFLIQHPKSIGCFLNIEGTPSLRQFQVTVNFLTVLMLLHKNKALTNRQILMDIALTLHAEVFVLFRHKNLQILEQERQQLKMGIASGDTTYFYLVLLLDLSTL